MLNGGGVLDRTGQWIVAGVVSLIGHVVLLSALFLWHTGRVPAALADRDVADVRSDTPETGPAKPETPSEPKAEPPSAAPVAEAKPVERPIEKPKAKPVAQPVEKPVVRSEPPVAEPPSAAESPAREVRTETYVVRKGDFLNAIAKSRGCTPADLARLNKTTVKKLSRLQVGQRIKVPKAD